MIKRNMRDVIKDVLGKSYHEEIYSLILNKIMIAEGLEGLEEPKLACVDRDDLVDIILTDVDNPLTGEVVSVDERVLIDGEVSNEMIINKRAGLSLKVKEFITVRQKSGIITTYNYCLNIRPSVLVPLAYYLRHISKLKNPSKNKMISDVHVFFSDVKVKGSYDSKMKVGDGYIILGEVF